MKKLNNLLAEFLGTFALVFFGCLAIIVNDTFVGKLGHIGISLVFGLVVMAMIYSIGNISGAHLNPAVSVCFLFAGRIRLKTVLVYITVQLTGALAASLVLRLMFPDHETLGATLPSVPWGTAFLFEFIFSFILMFVILNVSTGHMEKGIMAGVAVGGTITLEALVGGPLTGASMNPARSLGPALLSGQLASLEIYLLAPLAAAIAASPLCRLIQGNQCCSIPEDKYNE
ncbi:MAG: aquaporin [Spirochaetales bacterium]|nr:aquaporin [Spirochaetales bacterium]